MKVVQRKKIIQDAAVSPAHKMHMSVKNQCEKQNIEDIHGILIPVVRAATTNIRTSLSISAVSEYPTDNGRNV